MRPPYTGFRLRNHYGSMFDWIDTLKIDPNKRKPLYPKDNSEASNINPK